MTTRLVVCLLLLLLALPAQARRPNLVFILADDLGWGDLGCQGQTRFATPHLDRMAAEGVRFTQAYAGSTVCAPSRAVLMTGRHTGRASVRGNAGRANPQAQALRAAEVSVARLLQDAGYRTGLFGKWGLGDFGGAETGLPWVQGFDEFFGYLNQRHAHNYYPSHLWRDDRRVPLRNVVPDEDADGAGEAAVKAEYAHDLIADEALTFIRRHRGRPFFLHFTPTIPHANNEARARGMEVPDLGPYADRDWPAPQRAHAAMIHRLDRDVGRLLDLLRELGLGRDTLVFFSSDNGPHREGGFNPEWSDSNGPLRGIKRDLYEGGIRVPMLVWGPGRVPAGRVSDAAWWFADFPPTAAALAGVRPPAGLDGVDVTPLLTGRGRPPARPPLYWEFHEGGFKQALREGHWKAVRLAADAPLELYDLNRDPGEAHNLAAARPDIAGRLARLMDEARTDSPDWPVKRPGR
jgi:arylsulfatase A-like enzyme